MWREWFAVFSSQRLNSGLQKRTKLNVLEWLALMLCFPLVFTTSSVFTFNCGMDALQWLSTEKRSELLSAHRSIPETPWMGSAMSKNGEKPTTHIPPPGEH
uniref:UN3 n=1 Tax=Kamese virus TaxID=200402 RepID=A0A1V0QSV4_9RHAB|nr:UN3 [Kamese virus]